MRDRPGECASGGTGSPSTGDAVAVPATASRLVDVRSRWRAPPLLIGVFCAISVTPGALSLLTLVTRPARDISLPLFVREGEGGGSSTAGGLLTILRRTTAPFLR